MPRNAPNSIHHPKPCTNFLLQHSPLIEPWQCILVHFTSLQEDKDVIIKKDFAVQLYQSPSTLNVAFR